MTRLERASTSCPSVLRTHDVTHLVAKPSPIRARREGPGPGRRVTKCLDLGLCAQLGRSRSNGGAGIGQEHLSLQGEGETEQRPRNQGLWTRVKPRLVAP